MSASISFSGKLADDTVMLALALVVVADALFFLELPPDPQAPATRASTTTIAPTAPPRLNRIGSVPLLSICDQEGPGHHSAHLGRGCRAREDRGLALSPPPKPDASGGQSPLRQPESELRQHRQ